MSEMIAGRNPVREALRAGRPINKIVAAKGANTGPMGEIIKLAREGNIPIQTVERSHLDKLVGNTSHQGIIAYAAAKEYVEVEDILQIARSRGEEPFIVMLDEINDPHNLGAILRTVDAAGAHGVIIPQRRSVALTSTVAKASAGAVEYVPVARVTNLDQTLRMLKEEGLWVVGADMEGPEVYWQANLTGPLLLVIGGEGKGIGRLIRERCDLLVRLPMAGRVGSLNASVAAALLVYEVVRQRG